MGGFGADAIIGNGVANGLRGGAGDDGLDGAGGNDRLDGGTGADTMEGGVGDDAYVVDNASDLVLELENQGHDTVSTPLSTYGLAAGVETLLLLAGALNGTGNGLANRLVGNGAANRLDGAGGADTMVGGGGGDQYVVDDASDEVVEEPGGGSDIVSTTLSNYGLAAGVETLLLLAGALNGTGNGLANRLVGNGAANRLDGAGGADTMVGGGGGDQYVVDDASDEVVEEPGGGSDTVSAWVSFALSAGSYIEELRAADAASRAGLALTGNDHAQNLSGDAGNNALTGGGANDRLFGLLGKDRLKGDAGSDRLYGGPGSDVLTGGIGKDYFVFDAKLDKRTNVDRIVDFNVRDDFLQLENLCPRFTRKGRKAEGERVLGRLRRPRCQRPGDLQQETGGSLLPC